MPEMKPTTPTTGSEKPFAPTQTQTEPAPKGLADLTGATRAANRVDREFTIRERTQTEQVIRRFLQHRLAVVSLVIFVSMILFAFVGPLFWHYDYKTITPQFNTSPDGHHPFGTDDIGHDTFAVTMRGLQHSLMISFMLVAISIVAGTLLGAISGFYKGVVDSIVMRMSDLVLTIPQIAIAAALGAASGGSWWMIGLILGSLSIPYVARLVRGVVLSLREKEFIEASRALGASDWRILGRHLVPNAIGPVLVLATIGVAGGVLAETGLSAIGFGVHAPDTSLGLQISDAQFSVATHPYLFYIPGVFVILIALTINFVGDGLRDAFDPRQTRVRQ